MESTNAVEELHEMHATQCPYRAPPNEEVQDFVSTSSCKGDSDMEDGEEVDPWVHYLERMKDGEDLFGQNVVDEQQSSAQDELNRLKLARRTKSPQHWQRTELTIFVRLQVIRPAIWRSIVVPANLPLRVFANKVLIPAMGWVRNYHSYVFNVPGRVNKKISYGPVDSNLVDTMNIPALSFCETLVDDSELYVGDLLHSEGDRIRFIYNLTDRWKHEIILKKVEMLSNDSAPVRILEGHGVCPAEDSGGVYAYGKYLSSIAHGSKVSSKWDTSVLSKLKDTVRAVKTQKHFMDKHGLDTKKFHVEMHRKYLEDTWNQLKDDQRDGSLSTDIFTFEKLSMAAQPTAHTLTNQESHLDTLNGT